MNREQRIRKINRWLRVREWIDKKLSELHGASTKCPNCHVWSYQLALDKQPVWTQGDNDTELRVCGHCGNASRWIDTGFMGLMHCVDPDVETPSKPTGLTVT